MLLNFIKRHCIVNIPLEIRRSSCFLFLLFFFKHMFSWHEEPGWSLFCRANIIMSRSGSSSYITLYCSIRICNTHSRLGPYTSMPSSSFFKCLQVILSTATSAKKALLIERSVVVAALQPQQLSKQKESGHRSEWVDYKRPVNACSRIKDHKGVVYN